MRIAYFDAFAGLSGDMILGALLDAGLEEEVLRRELAQLPLEGYELEVASVQRGGIGATQVRVHVAADPTPRHLRDIEALLERSPLPEAVRQRSLLAFRLLAEAEARVHRTTPDRIHFHEVGAVDAIVDIVGAMIGLEQWQVERVYASPLPMGRGWVRCQHGPLPLPAPATLELLRGVPTYGVEVEGELVTPTGAAILRAVACAFGPQPPMLLQTIGYGAGHHDFPFPNLLRLLIGEMEG